MFLAVGLAACGRQPPAPVPVIDTPVAGGSPTIVLVPADASPAPADASPLAPAPTPLPSPSPIPSPSAVPTLPP